MECISYVLCIMCRQAEEAEAQAQAAQGGAAAAVRGARQAGVRLRGKEAEVTLSDLHAAAEARLSSWSAWVASRNSMDESNQEEGDDTVRSLPHCTPNATKGVPGASLFQPWTQMLKMLQHGSSSEDGACMVAPVKYDARPDYQESLWCAGGHQSVQAPDGGLPPGRHARQHGSACGPRHGGRPPLRAGERHMPGRSP